jgi:hypothetical protein
MPAQKLAHAKKGKKWREQCVESVAGMNNTSYLNGRTSWGRKQVNYDLVNSIIDETDFKHVMDPYGQGSSAGQQPAQLHDYNLITSKINLLKGEEMNRPLNHKVMAVNGEAVSSKEKKKKEMLMYVAQSKLAKAMGLPDMDLVKPDTGEHEPPQTFEEVEKFATLSMTDIREQWGNDILSYLKHKESLKLKFNGGWEHALIAAEEYYYIGIVNGEPKVRLCNPLNCEFDRNPDNPNIEDGDWFREDRWMTPGQILDEYGEYLTDAEIKQLDEGDLRRGLSNSMHPGFAYSQSDIDGYERGNFANRTRSNSTHLLVTEVCWKSMKKIGFVTYPDENDEYTDGMVNEDFKLTPEMKEAGYELEWRWIPEVWHGTKIAESFFVNIKPMPNQSRSMDDPSSVKLPYVGRIYNCTNTVQTSVVDLLKPYQYLYNIVWFRLEAEMAKAKGKKFIMDMAMIPKSEGIDFDKWMYMFDNVGIALINSFEEGKDQFQGQVSQFNQFQAIDVTLSQSVIQYLNILTKIEQMADKIVGISPQREGNVAQHETVGGVERAVTQSGYVTEPWFYIHNEIKKKVLTQLLETAKFAYPDSKKLHYIADDIQRISIEIDMDKFADSDYGLFVADSSKENAIFQKLESLSQQALSSGAAGLGDIVNMFRADSVGELASLIKDSEAKKQQQDQAAQEQAAQMQEQQIAAAKEQKAADQAFEANENQLDREADIRKAVIGTMGFDDDVQSNQVNDVLEYGKMALAETEQASKTELEHRKIDSDREIKSREHDLKREEIASKERMNKDNNRTALKNKVPGEK